MEAFDTRIREVAARGASPKFLAMLDRLMGEEYTSLDIAAALLAILLERENEGFDGGVSFEQEPSRERGHERGRSASGKRKPGAPGKAQGNGGSSKAWKGKRKRITGKVPGRGHGGRHGSPA